MKTIQKPIKRGKLRQSIGLEYHILKRRFKWLSDKEKYACKKVDSSGYYELFSHKSIILRKLQGVNMQLQENKRKNLELAIKNLDNICIKPGEIFSIWKLVGRPLKRKGYLEGLVLKEGKLSSGIGGGLCQLGNLLFWLFAHSPLEVKERYRHSYDVFPDVNRKVPFGAGATLAYNHIDLQLKNNTENTFLLKIWMDDIYLNAKLFSKEKILSTYELTEKNHKLERQFWGGYSRHNQVFKIENFPDGHKTETLLVENNAIMMYNPFLE